MSNEKQSIVEAAIFTVPRAYLIMAEVPLDTVKTEYNNPSPPLTRLIPYPTEGSDTQTTLPSVAREDKVPQEQTTSFNGQFAAAVDDDAGVPSEESDVQTTIRSVSCEENAPRTQAQNLDGQLQAAVTDDAKIPDQINQLLTTDHSIFMPAQSHPSSDTKMDPDFNKPLDATPKYYILDGMSARGKRKLVDDQGYSYTVKRQLSSEMVNWWCSVRNRTMRCRATVSQRNNQFSRGAYDHCHPPVPIKIQLKQEVPEYPTRPTRQVVKKMLAQQAPESSQNVSRLDSGPKPNRPFEDARRYQILDGVSERGKRKLVDDQGYSYSLKQRRVKGSINWCCSVRNKKVYCYATVSQHGDKFRRGRHEHNHPPTPGLATCLSIKAKVKQEAPKNLDQPVTEVVENVLGQLLPNSEECVALPKQTYLVKAAKRARARLLSSQTQELKLKAQEPGVKTSRQSVDDDSPQVQRVSPVVAVDADSSDQSDALFTVDQNVLIPDVSLEHSNQSSDPDADQPLGNTPRYQVMDGASERGNPKLVDHRGYSYTFKRKRANRKIDWICSIRNKNIRCHATVCQQDDQFHVGKNDHNHPPVPGIATLLSIKTKVKQEAPKDMTLPATEIVEKVLGEIVQENEPNVTLPSQTYLIKTVNRTRLRLQPRQPRARRPSFDDEPIQAVTDDGSISDQPDQSFNFGHSIFMPSVPHEQSVHNPELNSNKAISDPPHYQILDGVSERGKRKLVDSRGYSYTMKRKLVNGDFTWGCSVRNKTVCCRASVTQRGNRFRQGNLDHCHPPKPGLATSLAIKAKIKQEAPNNIFRPAPALVEKVLGQMVKDSESCASLPTQTCLVRTVNRARARYLQHHSTGTSPTDQSNDSFTGSHSIFMSDVPYEQQSIQYSDAACNQQLTGNTRQYHVLDGASERGKRKLMDDQGYTYTVKRQFDDGNVNWWCTVRNKTVRCRATVLQQGHQFHQGLHQHCHAPIPVKSKVKQEAPKEMFHTTPEAETMQVMEAQEDYSLHLLMGGLPVQHHTSQL